MTFIDVADKSMMSCASRVELIAFNTLLKLMVSCEAGSYVVVNGYNGYNV